MSQLGESACPTRQQLDELEALMQRMLSLPVSEGDEALPPVPAVEAKPRPVTLPPRLRAIPDPPTWTEPAAPPPPMPPPRPPVVEIADEYPAPPVVETANEYAPPVSSVAVEQVRAPAAEPAPPSVQPRPVHARRDMPPESVLLLPLTWTNHAFDRCTMRLGRPGRWLRGARGRAWIGWTGISFLALAATWAVVDWLGLTW